MSLETASVKTDFDLIDEFKAGNEQAFNELVSRYKEKAVQLACVTVGNYEDAKDVSQEAFVKVYHALKTFEARSKFTTWFYRILMNAAKDFLRKKKWLKFIGSGEKEEGEIFDRLVDPGVSPVKGLLNKELDHHMASAIKKLPFKQQWVFILRFIEGFSIQEISETAQLAEGTVKATLHFAIEKFKKEMTPYLEEGGR